MTMKVVLLDSAEQDLKDLKRYLVESFGMKTWAISYGEIKDAVRSLRNFPFVGGVPDEISGLNLTQFRQVISGRNRIIYEIRQDTIFIHIICDTRKDVRSLLISRVLRAP